MIDTINNKMEMNWSWVKGFFEGDGNSSYNPGGIYLVAFTQKNPEILYKIKEFIGCGNKVVKVNGGAYKFRITDKYNVSRILNSMSQAEKNISYYAGLIEAEGCFGSSMDSKFSFCIAMYDKEVIEDFKEFFKIQSIKVNERINKWNKKYYSYTINSFKDCVTFCNILKEENFISSHKRKQFIIFKEVMEHKLAKSESKDYYFEKSMLMKEIKKDQYTEVF